MHRRSSMLALAVVVAVALTGCNNRPARTAADAPLSATPAPIPTVDRAPYIESPSPSPSTTPTLAPAPTKAPRPTYDVKGVQRSLTSLRYYLGAVDGRPGPALRSAVMAFQKVQGIGADGSVGKDTLAALKAPKPPVLKATAPANRVEVDLTKQVLYVVSGGKVERILPVSSGNGKTYLQKDGGKARALTPVGWYKIQRRIIGERNADLGTLYDPQYFYRGWAIHGSNSVPARPASHGCIRVTRADAKWLLGKINVGTHVYLYGGTHTFTAGSSAPGTDAPSGDTPESAPSEAPSPTPAPQPTAASPSASASASPSPTASPSGSSSPKSSALPTAAPTSSPQAS